MNKEPRFKAYTGLWMVFGGMGTQKAGKAPVAAFIVALWAIF